MKPKSSTLFHFTKDVEVLKSILKDGFWPRYCLEDVRWLGFPKFDYIAYPMVCFCDIPLSRISEHVEFYGKFGIGIKKDWALSSELNPVLYCSGKNIANSFRSINQSANKLKGDDRFFCKEQLRHLLAYSKPYTGVMNVRDNVLEKDFYQESEWRYVPLNDSVKLHVLKRDFDDKDRMDALNSLTKEKCMLRFKSCDVMYIFVESDDFIPDVISFIQASLGDISVNQQRILMSRVVSLEGLRQDV